MEHDYEKAAQHYEKRAEQLEKARDVLPKGKIALREYYTVRANELLKIAKSCRNMGKKA